MSVVVSCRSMRECEERNFAADCADPRELMQIAGSSCAEKFLDFLQSQHACRRVVIYSGSGNNGGDGVVMAGILAEKLAIPVVLALVDPQRLSDSGKYFFDQLPPAVMVTAADTVELRSGDVAVDALLGTGCHGNLREPYCTLIKRINEAQVPVFSVDIPSGLGCDLCVKASITAAIGFFKDIMFTVDGVEMCGSLRKVPLPLPLPPEAPEASPLAMDAEYFNDSSIKLPRNIHKYQRGSVLICGGSSQYFQAPFLSARAALRSGAGLVRLAVPFNIAPGCGTLGVIPTTVTDKNGSFCAASFQDIEAFLPKTDVIASGPGMGRSREASDFIARLLELDKALLLDADAIHLAAAMIEKLSKRTAPTLLTPHRGEAAALAKALQISLSGSDLDDARALAAASNCTILLKGARTVIADNTGRAFINTSGTPALATAGSGDTLTGLAAAEMCHHPVLEAAARSAFLHGTAGEMAALSFGECGVIADDLPEFIAQAGAALAGNGDIFG